MVHGLTILTNNGVGSRDLWWKDDPEATAGYNIYRAYDTPTNWVLLNPSPQPGHFYRDASTLIQTTYAVQPTDMVAKGEIGAWVIRIPDVPYCNVVGGRPEVANSPQDVSISYSGQTVAPVRVSGVDRAVWINTSQDLPTGGAVSQFSYPDPTSATSLSVTYNKLANFVDVYSNLTRTFYTVVSVGASGELYTPNNCEIVNAREVDRMDFIQKEMIRRNQWIIEQVGEPAYVMFRKTRGVKCGCTQDGVSQPRTTCPSCFEIGWVGGYYGPYDIVFTPADSAITRTINEGGIKTERPSKCYLGPTPIVQDGDLIVRRNGERLVISQVNYLMPRGVLVQQEFDVQLLTVKDTRYNIPVNLPRIGVNGLPLYPALYNPAIEMDPAPGQAEPIVTPLPPSWAADTQFDVGMVVHVNGYVHQCTVAGITGDSSPAWNQTLSGTTADGTITWTNTGQALESTKLWQNQKVPVGRTVVFGNIQG